MIGIIYKVTNDLNDKVYIGQTMYLLENRWEWHINKANNPNDNCKFHKALRELGIQHFKIEELIRVDKSMLDNYEIDYIKQYNSYLNGYNSTFGGGGKRSYIYSNQKIIQDIITLYNKGFSSNKIAAKYKVDKGTILKLLKFYNVEIDDRFFHPDALESNIIIQKYLKGEGLNKIGRSYGVSSSTIKRFLQNHNIPISPKNYILRDREKCRLIALDYKEHNVNMQYTMHKYNICFSTLKTILNMFQIPVKNTNGKLKTV